MSEAEWTVPAEAFARLLRRAAPAAKAAVWQGDPCRLELAGGRLEARADNLTLAIAAWTAVAGEGAGAIVAPLSDLAALVGRLSGDVRCRIGEQGLEVEAGSTRAVVRTLPRSEFASRPEPGGRLVEVDAGALRGILARVEKCASPNDSRVVLTAVQLEPREGGTVLAAAAADGYRMAMAEAPASGGDDWPERGVLVPAPAARALLRLLPDGGPIRLGLADQGGWLAVGWEGDGEGWVWRSALVDGRMFDLRGVVPKEPSTRVECDRAGMADALRIASPFGRHASDAKLRDKWTSVWLSVGADGATLLGEDADKGSCSASVPATVDGPPARHLLDSGFLGDALASATGERVALELDETAGRYVVLREPGGAATWVVVPMSVEKRG